MMEMLMAATDPVLFGRIVLSAVVLGLGALLMTCIAIQIVLQVRSLIADIKKGKHGGEE